MTSRRSFYRKIAYLLVIGILVLPLLYLGMPATSGMRGGQGGKLAQLRSKHGLSEAELGQIDPTSETIKLATFGMRGVAANILWEKANRYDKKKDWTNLSATLQQIAKLEPHFISVWRFQAWRASYNVSAQFDDYRGRYQWVIKGINFLKEGIRYNENEPKLYWDVGWFTSQKIGRADEHKQFRRLFREDDDFHGSRPPELRDNWLVGKESFVEAEELVDKGASLGNMSPVLFYAQGPMCQMNYAEALEDDGIFEEKARLAWNRASREWYEYGDRDLLSTFGDVIQLNDRQRYHQMTEDLRAQLDAMLPGIQEKIAEERRAALSALERETIETPPEDRTEEQHRLAAEVNRKLKVTYEDAAKRLIGAERGRALDLAEKLSEAERIGNIIGRYQDLVNYEYWHRRAAVEQTPQALEARKLFYEGRRAFVEQTNLPLAREKYEAGMAKWREVLDSAKFPGLVEDSEFARELIDAIKVYRRILDASDEPFPENFILRDILERHKDLVEEAD